MLGSLALPQLPAAAQAPAASQTSTEQPEADALLAEHERAAAKAYMTGKPVPVESLTTETEQVLAQPRGGFERVSTVEPTRTKKSGKWQDIDTTLTLRSDGTVAPKVTEVDLALSGGGSSVPLAQVAHDGVEVTLGWDTTFWGKGLPKPELSGDTGLYREVLAGVDLEVQVTGEGFRQVLIVKTAEAARNPKLDELRFHHKVEGGQVEKELTDAPAGPGEPAPSTLEVTDSGGDVVFEGDASRMWDSSGKIADTYREATVAEDDDRAAVMGVEVDADSVEITPDQEFLADPATEYPVFIDPNYICVTCDSRDDYLVVYEKNGSVGDRSWNNDDENLLKVGQVHDVKARSYFDFDISDVPTTANITSATLQLTVNNSYYPDCRGTTTVYFTSYISSSMYWGNEPTKGWGVDGDGYVGTINQGNKPSGTSECTGNWQRTSSVTPGIQDLRRDSHGQATFGLYASTYASATDWRRFKTNPGLTIKYSLPPKVPASQSTVVDTTSVGCSSALKVDWVTKGADVTLKAKVDNVSTPEGSTYDGGSWVRAKFAVKGYGDSSWSYYPTSYQATGGTHTLDVPAEFLQVQAEQERYFEWRVRSEDSLWSESNGVGHASAYVGSGVNQSCFVMVDLKSPDTPGVTSDDNVYPPLGSGAHGGVGKTGEFTLSPGTATGWQGSVDVAKYKWSLEPDKFDKTALAGTNGTAKIAVTPTKTGLNTIYVKAYDKAGNTSLRVTKIANRPDTHEAYTFDVAGGEVGLRGSWELDGSGAGRPGQPTLTLQGSAAFSANAGFAGQGLHLPGSTGSYAQTSALLSTNESYSVAAWTRLDSKDHDGTAIAQDGSVVSRFKLQYLKNEDRWSFSLYSANTSTPTVARVTSTAAPKLNEWTHVAGVYDANTKSAKLYVDGKAQGSAVDIPGDPWHATEGFVVGSGKSNGVPAGLFQGGIDRVRAYGSALSDADVAGLANEPVVRSWHKLDENSGTTAADTEGEGSNNNGTVVRLADPSTANAVANADLESWTNGVPECVDVDGWGQNTHQLSQVPGRSGQAAAQLVVSDFTDGIKHIGPAQAACAPEVEPGQRYDVSLWYQSSTDEIALDVFMQNADGSWTWWETLSGHYTADDWTRAAETTPVVPDGVQRISVRLTVKGAGRVAVDDFRVVLANDGSNNSARPGSVAWDPYGSGAVFSGWGGSQDMAEIVADLPSTVSSRKSFTVAAHVHHDRFDESTRQAVSLSGSNYMPIGLGYRSAEQYFAATVVTGSQDNPAIEPLLSDRPAVDDDPNGDGWVHLALTYDATRGQHGEIRLFVDGQPQSTVLTLSAPLAVDAGKLIIGRGTSSGGMKSEPWKGGVRDVRVTSGVVSPQCINAWANNGPCGGP